MRTIIANWLLDFAPNIEFQDAEINNLVEQLEKHLDGKTFPMPTLLSAAMQTVADAVAGSLWHYKDLLIKISEEVGELGRAVNRQQGNPETEAGDVLFALLCLCIGKDIDISRGLISAINKHHDTVGTERAQIPC